MKLKQKIKDDLLYQLGRECDTLSSFMGYTRDLVGEWTRKFKKVREFVLEESRDYIF